MISKYSLRERKSKKKEWINEIYVRLWGWWL